jgi:hypothetical protein
MRPDRNPSKHSLNRCADLAANAQPRDEGIRFTSSLVLVWGKRCPAVAGRCLEHNEASRRAASSRRMTSAVQHEWCTKRRRCCPATTAADEAPSPWFISLLEGQLRHTHTQTHQLAMTERNTAISRIADVPRSDRRRKCQLLAPIGFTEIPALWLLPGAKRTSASDLPNNRD